MPEFDRTSKAYKDFYLGQANETPGLDADENRFDLWDVMEHWWLAITDEEHITIHQFDPACRVVVPNDGTCRMMCNLNLKQGLVRAGEYLQEHPDATIWLVDNDIARQVDQFPEGRLVDQDGNLGNLYKK